MRKTALIIIILLIALSGISIQLAHAQTFDFAKAYQDYQYTLSVYNQSFADYQDARDFYLKNPTLTLKEDARKKTLTMLRNRDELMKVYLTALRMKIVETQGLDSDDKNNIFGKIDAEVAWYQDHEKNYLDNDPLENLFGKSSESESRYKTNTSPISYEALFYVSLGTEQGLRTAQEDIYKNLRSIIDQDVAAGKYDINPFNRWFTDIESVIQELNQNEDKARKSIQKMYDQNYIQPTSTFNASIDPLNSSIDLLSQLNRFLVEVTTSIQNQTK